MPARVHSFRERLASSESPEDEAFWDAFYRSQFPDMVTHTSAFGDNPTQRMGIDRILLLTNGRTLYIDEKMRDTDYSDVLLEYVSNDKTMAPGWIMKDLAIDFISYAFRPSRKCLLLPWHLLKRAWALNVTSWDKDFGRLPACNKDYKTWSVPVPIPRLLSAIGAAALSVVPENEQGAEY